MGRIQGGLPVVGKALLQSEEDLIELFVVVSPVWRRAVRTIVMFGAAVGVPARQTAPGLVIDIDTLVFVASGQRGAGAQIGVQNPGEEGSLLIVVVEPGVAVLITRYDAAAQIAVFRQRALHIHYVTLFVPATVFS